MSGKLQAIWAVVPVKDLKNAKQRLSPVLETEQRRSLLRAMLHDVLAALTETACLAGVMLVTRDTEIRKIAQRFPVKVLVERDNRGHTAAVTRAAHALAAKELRSMLTVPADIPLMTPADIEALIGAHADLSPAVTIAPARDELGSNAMLCSPPDVLPFRFGDNSFFPHLQSARELGIEPRVVERTGLGLDIDTPDDLRAFAAGRSATHAYDYLERSGLVALLRGNEEPSARPLSQRERGKSK
ncbi:MAG: 2-phospho-L-lactate guanylyltransferase [Gammaproteobacteria bacterium]|nr:2-phospho-L-lactate guanylyltransferase [Gammaproteobacteria bacterium]